MSNALKIAFHRAQLSTIKSQLGEAFIDANIDVPHVVRFLVEANGHIKASNQLGASSLSLSGYLKSCFHDFQVLHPTQASKLISIYLDPTWRPMSNVAALARMDEQMPVVKHTKAFHRQQFIHTHPYLLDPIHRFYSMHRSVINSLKYQYNRQKSNVDEGLADLITKVHLADPQSQSLLKAWVKAYVKSPEPYQRLDGQGLLAVAKEINGSKDMAQKIYRMLCSHKTQESDGPKALQQAFQVCSCQRSMICRKGCINRPHCSGLRLDAQEKAQQRVQLYQIDRLSYRDQLSKLESICGGPVRTHLVSKSMLDHLDQKSERRFYQRWMQPG